MNKIILLSIFLYLQFGAICSFAQKRTVDHFTWKKWPTIRNIRFSNNGKYLCYNIIANSLGQKLVVQSVDNKFLKEFPAAYNQMISEDSKFIFYLFKDSLGIFSFENKELRITPGVKSFKAPLKGTGRWLACKKNNSDLILYDLLTESKNEYTNVNDYYFDNIGSSLIINAINPFKNNLSLLISINLENKREDTISKGNCTFEKLTFDVRDSQMAFVQTKDTLGIKQSSIILYKKCMKEAFEIIIDTIDGFKSTKQVYNLINHLQFSKNGNQLFFEVQQMHETIENDSSNPEVADVTLWSYRDSYLPGEQLSKIEEYKNNNKSFIGVINLHIRKAIKLTENNDDISSFKFCEGRNDSIALVRTRYNSDEMNSILAPSPTYHLISTKNGSRNLIISGTNYLSFSPEGRYIIWYDKLKSNYFTFNTVSGVIKNITGSITVPLYDDEDDRPKLREGFDSPIWLENDSAVLISDRYDIWQVDPNNSKPSINITNRYGYMHKIVFRYLNISENSDVKSVVQLGEELILMGFDRRTKNNGFFSKILNAPGDPKLLTMGPYIYYLPQLSNSSEVSFPTLPIKSKDANSFIVTRMSCTEYPNLYFTHDFKSYSQLSDLSPHKEFNWFSSQLIHWKLPDGKTAEGIIYKPENFNLKEKYPILFFYYEKASDRLNQFISPSLSRGEIDIPYYVSNGYLVFVPNIYYKVGYPGKSAYNSVVSAAKHLAKFPWVNAQKMGLQGHSFGGYETNYIITKTKLFVAAAAAAAPVDFISGYGSLRGAGYSSQYLYEIDQNRLGATLWQKPNLYIENSPIFYADKVRTPILIMHNREDKSVPWSQGLEWFLALRRLGKKVWMLQYGKGGHSINYEKNQLDYSIRLGQFFDYYLKGKNPPKWMTNEFQQSKKNILSNLEIDYSNSKP